jgi:uncharacterized protein
MHVQTLHDLRLMYGPQRGRTALKELDRLDKHCLSFIALSPFVVIASTGAPEAGGAMDASPRGGAPGFVKVPDAHTLLIPDAPGNNRLDSFENIVATGRIGLIFLIPGIDETLRINGHATLRTDSDLLDLCTSERRRPVAVVRVEVQAAYLHCAKALMRARLWSADARVERGRLPSTAQILNDHTGVAGPLESEEAMRRRYAADL